MINRYSRIVNDRERTKLDIAVRINGVFWSVRYTIERLFETRILRELTRIAGDSKIGSR